MRKLLVFLTLLVLVGCAAQESPQPRNARPAADFGASVGVNTKVGYQGTPLGDCANTKAALAYMGIKHIRDEGFRLAWDVNGRECLRQIGAAGNRLNLQITGCWNEDEDRVLQVVRDWRDSGLKPYTDSLENPNEVNFQHSACPVPEDWAVHAQNIAARLWYVTRSDGIKIIGPSLAGPHEEEELVGSSDLPQWMDWGNMHPYRGTGIPETAIPEEKPFADKVAQGKPVSITEFGWMVPEWAPTERVQGIYTMRAFLDHFDKGIPRSFVHQIVDFDGHFGLYRNDWTPKAAATHMRNLTTLVGANEPRVANPGSLNFGWSSVPEDARFVLLRTPSYFAAVVWRAIPHNGATDQITVTAGQRTTRVRRFDPTVGTAYLQNWNNPKTFNLTIGPSPIVLRIFP